MAAVVQKQSGIQELSESEGHELLEREAQRLLGMTADEFKNAWEAGELDPDDARVVDVALLLPFGR